MYRSLNRYIGTRIWSQRPPSQNYVVLMKLNFHLASFARSVTPIWARYVICQTSFQAMLYSCNPAFIHFAFPDLWLQFGRVICYSSSPLAASMKMFLAAFRFFLQPKTMWYLWNSMFIWLALPDPWLQFGRVMWYVKLPSKLCCTHATQLSFISLSQICDSNLDALSAIQAPPSLPQWKCFLQPFAFSSNPKLCGIHETQFSFG